MTKSFYSNGKLLLTGEYAVLDGALSLALPTKYGQSMLVEEMDTHELCWRSFDENEDIWFEGTIDLSARERAAKGETSFSNSSGNGRQKSAEWRAIAETLSEILYQAKKLNPDFLGHHKGYSVETKLSFSRDWGLGSSSTLINNIAKWAEVDAYQLVWNAFSGSGYDIACAQKNHPILYSLVGGKSMVSEVDFNPSFQDRLYFIHLNKKQNSREGIASYREKDFNKTLLVEKISAITRKTVSCTSLSEFESLMNAHETLLSQTLGMPTVKQLLFADFEGTIKSLGAWGGDFILATGNQKTPSYFKKLGYTTVVPFADMVLKPGI